MTLRKVYSREMRHELGVFPVWQPGDPIEVGDIGTLDEGAFQKQTTMKSLFPDYRLKIERQPLNRPYRFSSRDCIIGQLQTSGSLPAEANAMVEVKFGSEGGVIFEATDIRRTSIDDLFQCREFIKTHRKLWPSKGVLVTAVDTANSFRLLISATRNGSATLSGRADALSGMKIADASISISTNSAAGYQVTPGAGAIAAQLSGFGWLGYLAGDFHLLEMETEPDFVDLMPRDFPEQKPS